MSYSVAEVLLNASNYSAGSKARLSALFEIIADPFALSVAVMICFDVDPLTPRHSYFNCSVICTRRVVEQAFGHLNDDGE